VYRFKDGAGRVLYLGRAVSLRRRVASYWGDLGDRGHLAAMVARVATVEAVVCDSAHEAAWLERNLLQAQLPPWNRSPTGGQEKEVWIRLRESARAPGLQIVHRPSPRAREFGPYLGGLQVRRAVSGLSRVLPLAYAGGELSGTRHEMARALQKVTRPAPDDFDVCGWADGVLIRFTVRAGRLSGWSQGSCDAAAGRRHLGGTPPAWTGFAQRNAELAARLGVDGGAGSPMAR
jgi:hypothetical protein